MFFGVNWRFEFIFWRLYFVGGCRVCSFFFFRLIMFVDYVYKVGIVFCFVSLANVFIYRRFLVCLKRIKFVSEGFKIFYRVIVFIWYVFIFIRFILYFIWKVFFYFWIGFCFEVFDIFDRDFIYWYIFCMMFGFDMFESWVFVIGCIVIFIVFVCFYIVSR